MKTGYRSLMIAPTPFFSNRGCHIRIAEQARACIKLGMDIHIVTYPLGNTPTDFENLVTRTMKVPGYTKREAGPSWYKPYIDLLLLFKTMKLLRTMKPDVIHAHLHEGLMIGWLARILTGKRNIPLLFDAQGSLVREMLGHHAKMPKWIVRILAAIERFLFNRADGVITSSDSMTEFVEQEKLAREDQHLMTAPDSANIHEPISPEQFSALRTKLNIPLDATVLIYAGGLTADKGFDVLFDAMVPLLKKEPNFYFLCIGYPIDQFVPLVKKAGVEKQVVFTGGVPFEELPLYQQISTMGVDPKSPLSSQASGKLLNYMASRLPIVAFDSLNNRKMMPEGNLLAPEHTAESLEKTIETMLHYSTEEREALGEKNIAYLQKHFSWDTTATIISSAYEKLVQRTDRSR